MANALSLTRNRVHDILTSIIGDDRVYFQPPESIKLKYPCIIYNLSDTSNTYGDNISYLLNVGFDILLVDRDPESIYVTKLLSVPYSTFNRYYVADNINHWSFTLTTTIKEA